jgi:hypothetical protein
MLNNSNLQCLHPMLGIGILPLNESLKDPPPFISTANHLEKAGTDKIARFTHNFVVCARVPTGLMGPTGQKIMKLCRFSCLEWKCKFYGVGWAAFGHG